MIADGTLVRALGGLPASVDDAALAPLFGPAETRLRGWVGDEAYQDAELPTPGDQDRAAAPREGEAYLVLYYVVPKLGMVLAADDSGYLSYEHEAANTAQYRYLPPEQLEEQRTAWLRDAAAACAAYLTPVTIAIGRSPAEKT